ncbi:hypothetical protein RRG08_032196 [Elysia crispata]|uniref:Uncharacterized protein n=1 Tax=Elysia crispata TaxID=231223 RepID=A0AAE1ABW8_9GAST|nr:hypothetical protein RRG08_032196 [Elysia crispata]
MEFEGLSVCIPRLPSAGQHHIPLLSASLSALVVCRGCPPLTLATRAACVNTAERRACLFHPPLPFPDLTNFSRRRLVAWRTLKYRHFSSTPSQHNKTLYDGTVDEVVIQGTSVTTKNRKLHVLTESQHSYPLYPYVLLT